MLYRAIRIRRRRWPGHVSVINRVDAGGKQASGRVVVVSHSDADDVVVMQWFSARVALRIARVTRAESRGNCESSRRRGGCGRRVSGRPRSYIGVESDYLCVVADSRFTDVIINCARRRSIAAMLAMTKCSPARPRC